MSNMQVFYKNIKATPSESNSTYFPTLAKLTRLEPFERKLLVTGLGWENWSTSVPLINANR